MSIESTAAVTALIDALAGPAKVSGDAGSVEQYSLSDLIAAHKYLAGIAASNSPRRGLRFTRMVPDGTVHVRQYRRYGGWEWRIW